MIRNDVLYAVTSYGVMKSNDFGKNWQAKQIEGNWSSSFWSGTDVEVSLANPRFVWAGSSMSSSGNIFLSSFTIVTLLLSKWWPSSQEVSLFTQR